MKLIIQIPCYNEEKTLESVLSSIPKNITGINEIRTQIIDDGSSDNTINVAQKAGVDYIIIHKKNKGLGNAFRSGVENALKHGADILVNTDGDNQYPSQYISDLVQPIIEQKADIVMGDRQTKNIEHFSRSKKFFQWLGSMLVRFVSGTDVPDSVTGFRAYNRESLLKLNITSDFSYAVDTIVQAGSKKLAITHIAIHTNAPTRKSRLFKNMWQHMCRTFTILVRVYAMYHPLKIFSWLGFIFSVIGFLGVGRFLYFYIQNPEHSGHMQSLSLGGAFLVIATVFFALGIIGDLIAKNRRLIEDNLYISKKNFYGDK